MLLELKRNNAEASLALNQYQSCEISQYYSVYNVVILHAVIDSYIKEQRDLIWIKPNQSYISN